MDSKRVFTSSQCKGEGNSKEKLQWWIEKLLEVKTDDEESLKNREENIAQPMVGRQHSLLEK